MSDVTIEESRQLNRCICALRSYYIIGKSIISKLSKENKRISDQSDKLLVAIQKNSEILTYIADICPNLFSGQTIPEVCEKSFVMDMEEFNNIDAALRTSAREWTTLGEKERMETYYPIIESLENYCERGSKILVPGSGVCRLAVEIAAAGFIAEANENAFIMLGFSLFCLLTDGKFNLYPFVHQTSGVKGIDDLILNYEFPDRSCCLKCCRKGGFGAKNCKCLSAELFLHEGRLLPKAGDFYQTYENKCEEFDGIASAFFIDSVPDPRKAMEFFYKLLKPGGVLINVGPTHPHFNENDVFTTLTLKDVDRFAMNCGFEIEEQRRISTTYAQHPTSYVRHEYDVMFSVYRK